MKKNTRANTSPPLILVADDEDIFHTLIVNFMKDDGYKFIKASNGKKALAVFKKHHPDLALLDASMPIMDGFKTCKALRKLPKGRKLPL